MLRAAHGRMVKLLAVAVVVVVVVVVVVAVMWGLGVRTAVVVL